MENKTSKYFKYALGEIILVVIGILIALQINNWNENRKEVIQEQKILQAIAVDFAFNKKEIEENIEETQQTVEGTDKALQYFNVPATEMTEQQAHSLIRHMTSFSTFHPSDGALNDLINSGRLNIIKNDSLKDKLSNWNSLVLDVTEDEEYLLSFMTKHLEPIQLEAVSYSNNTRFNRNSKAYFESPKFENIVMTLNRMARYQIQIYTYLKTDIEEIQTLLENEIK
jgi:hypothetical protein